MLVVIPILVWISLWLLWLDRTQHAKGSLELSRSVRSSALIASLIWATALAVISEIASLLHVLNRGSVALAWGLILASLCLAGVRKGRFQRGLHYLVDAMGQVQRGEWLLFLSFGVLSGLLLLVQLLAPANNTDSFQYHLSRVMHWAQNSSLNHYATAFVQQLYNPIWAEEAILHLRLLSGSDRLAGLVQWSAMLLSTVSVTLIASELGVSRLGQWLAAAFAFSVPMGLLQATSTQNDYVVAFWLVCVAWLVLQAVKRPFTSTDSILLGMAAGMGLLTKGIFYPFVLPFGIWFLLASLRWGRKQPLIYSGIVRRIGQTYGLVSLTIVVLNAAYWLRNLLTFGGPLGPSEWVTAMTAGQYGVGPFVASLIRNAVMNFATPSERINDQIVQIVQGRLMHLDSRMADFRLIWGWNHEDIAGNPLHVLVIIVVFLILLVGWKGVEDRRLWAYVAAISGVYALFSLIVHTDLYGTRYELAIFILAAPLVGAVSTLLTSGRIAPKADVAPTHKIKTLFPWRGATLVFILFLLAASLPWILMNRSRPLLALKDGGEPYSIPCQPILGCTIGSILFEPPTTLIFANWIELREPYLQIGRDLKATSCTQIGLRLDSHDLEYLFWWVLDAPQSGTRLETIYTFPDLERYIDPNFKPCAIICTICGDRTQLHGLPLASEYAGLKLFMGPDYSSMPGP